MTNRHLFRPPSPRRAVGFPFGARGLAAVVLGLACLTVELCGQASPGQRGLVSGRILLHEVRDNETLELRFERIEAAGQGKARNWAAGVVLGRDGSFETPTMPFGSYRITVLSREKVAYSPLILGLVQSGDVGGEAIYARLRRSTGHEPLRFELKHERARLSEALPVHFVHRLRKARGRVTRRGRPVPHAIVYPQDPRMALSEIDWQEGASPRHCDVPVHPRSVRLDPRHAGTWYLECDAQGRFTIPYVGNGTWALRALGRDEHASSEAKHAELDVAHEPEEIQLELGSSRVRGRLGPSTLAAWNRGSSLQLYSGAEAALRPTSFAWHGAPLHVRTQSIPFDSGTGVFELRGLSPGPWVLRHVEAGATCSRFFAFVVTRSRDQDLGLVELFAGSERALRLSARHEVSFETAARNGDLPLRLARQEPDLPGRTRALGSAVSRFYRLDERFREPIFLADLDYSWRSPKGFGPEIPLSAGRYRLANLRSLTALLDRGDPDPELRFDFEIDASGEVVRVRRARR